MRIFKRICFIYFKQKGCNNFWGIVSKRITITYSEKDMERTDHVPHTVEKGPGQIYHYLRTSISYRSSSDNNANAFFTGFRNKERSYQSDGEGAKASTLGDESQWEIIDKNDPFLNNMNTVAKETQSFLDSSQELKQSVLQLTNTFGSSLTLQNTREEEAPSSSGSCVDGIRCTFRDCVCRSGKWSPYLKFSLDDLREEEEANGASEFEERAQAVVEPEQEFLDSKQDIEKDGVQAAEEGKPCTSSTLAGNDSDIPDTGDQTGNDQSSGDWYTAPNTPQDYCLVEMPGTNSLDDSACPTEFINYASDDEAYSPHRKLCIEGQRPSEVDNCSSEPIHFPPKSTEDKNCSSDNSQQKVIDVKEKQPIEKHGQGDAKVDDAYIASGRREAEGTETSEQEEVLRPKSAPRPALLLPNPPVIPVSNLQYEVDQMTGMPVSIGKGSFGQVFKAQFANPQFRHYPIVVKEFDKEFTNSKEVCEECQRLIYLKDTGYVPVCYGLVPFGDPQNPMYGIVQEYVGTGLTLEMFLWDHSEMEFLSWINVARQCCEGLARFHDKGILLNDIKTNNILLDYQDHNGMVLIKYIDFGLATDMRGKRFKSSKSLEEFSYLAPEVRLQGQRTTLATDVFR